MVSLNSSSNNCDTCCQARFFSWNSARSSQGNCRMIIRQFPCELLALFQEKNLAWQHVSQLLELEFKDTISKIPLEYIKLIQHFF